MKDTTPTQDKYLRPLDAPITNIAPQQKYIPWRFGQKQGIQGRKIRESYAKINNLTAIQSTLTNLVAAVHSLTNSLGGTIVDSTGIVSTANFLEDDVTSVTPQSTTSTTPVDLTGSSLTPFVVTRSVKASVFVSSFGYNLGYLSSDYSGQIQCVDTVNGTLLNYPFYIQSSVQTVNAPGPPYTNFNFFFDSQWSSSAVVVDLSAGTHTLKLQYYVNGGGTATVNVFQLGYVVYGS